jgi:hypothetical protein
MISSRPFFCLALTTRGDCVLIAVSHILQGVMRGQCLETAEDFFVWNAITVSDDCNLLTGTGEFVLITMS